MGLSQFLAVRAHRAPLGSIRPVVCQTQFLITPFWSQTTYLIVIISCWIHCWYDVSGGFNYPSSGPTSESQKFLCLQMLSTKFVIVLQGCIQLLPLNDKNCTRIQRLRVTFTQIQGYWQVRTSFSYLIWNVNSSMVCHWGSGYTFPHIFLLTSRPSSLPSSTMLALGWANFRLGRISLQNSQ